jgi:hypothetical protein
MSTLFQERSAATFPCPNCHQILSADVDHCKFCSVHIDQEAAASAAKLQDKINKACDDASMLRNVAGAMWVFWLARLIPFIGFIAGGATIACFLIAAIWIIHWRVRYGRIATSDTDYSRAKTNWSTALVFWWFMALWFVFVDYLNFFSRR